MDFFLSSWFFGLMTRSTAEKMLLVPGIPSGSFLIRDSESKSGYSLSIRSEDEVMHYLIVTKTIEKVNSFFVYPWALFPSLAELVQHYSNDADRLCCKLTHPYGKVKQLIKSGHNDTGGAPRLNGKLEAGQEQADEGNTHTICG